MLAKEDLQLIEKFLASEFTMPYAQALSKEEQILWNQKMKDLEFRSHVQIERELYECLSKQKPDDEHHLRSTLKNL
jgi:hypothetical protein